MRKRLLPNRGHGVTAKGGRNSDGSIQDDVVRYIYHVNVVTEQQAAEANAVEEAEIVEEEK